MPLNSTDSHAPNTCNAEYNQETEANQLQPNQANAIVPYVVPMHMSQSTDFTNHDSLANQVDVNEFVSNEEPAPLSCKQVSVIYFMILMDLCNRLEFEGTMVDFTCSTDIIIQKIY